MNVFTEPYMEFYLEAAELFRHHRTRKFTFAEKKGACE